MAKFIYRMQGILELKYKMENQAKNAFGAANAALLTEQEKLEALEGRLEGYEEEGRGLRKNKVRPVELRENQEAIRIIQDMIAAQQIEIRKAQEKVELCRQALQEAMMERKIQEKLKDNAFEAFMQEENKKESKEIDELTSYTYGRKAVAGQ
ncbi:MAG: flagellar export protein FliJ [Lachnospiraceae bacterium]|nr:flagellar export protein FliJ [Lachnospiraceae bacterium]